MTTQDAIAKYVKELRFKRSFLGCKEEDVLDAVSKIDSMYGELLDAEQTRHQSILDGYAQQISALEQDKRSLTAQNGAQRQQIDQQGREVDALHMQLEDAQRRQEEYTQKTQRLIDAVVAVEEAAKTEQERTALERETTLNEARQEAQNMIEQARQEAQRMIEQAQQEAQMIVGNGEMELNARIADAENRIEQAQTKKTTVLNQLRFIQMTVGKFLQEQQSPAEKVNRFHEIQQ